MVQEQHMVASTDSLGFQQLIENISSVVQQSRSNVATSINRLMVEAYWQIGKYIVEFEQKGECRAQYGSALLTRLSKELTLKMGKGFSRPNLNHMRRFYLLYPICQTVSSKFSWSQLCLLMQAEDELERKFYEKECYEQKWNVRTLKRQMDSALYLRLAASLDKEGILTLAKEGNLVQTADDIVKDSYTLEFLGIKEEEHYSEDELEQRIIDNLQMFLLEMGKGLTFVRRQYPIALGTKTYHCDLVFYHRILKCFVLIDLKRAGVQHEDIGQMNMYLGYFAKEENVADDNPPIGIILSHYRDDLLVEYATYGITNQLYVSKYELYLPNKEELRQIVNKTLEE
ncbi:MAG: PDDEXK nuclease domain-containing protein [Paludibacteraceae bacterium]|nr:PDDEXK nuclease domain-containing protein [Paludibacteraceae bacterium]